ncbi:MAG: hypothetical protein R3F11_32705 [Verrucomicrobiales bacterium]
MEIAGDESTGGIGDLDACAADIAKILRRGTGVIPADEMGDRAAAAIGMRQVGDAEDRYRR